MSQALLHAYALSFLGIPYRWAGDDPMAGVDCSGLVLELLKADGVVQGPIDMTAQHLFNLLERGKTAALRYGTLLFFGKSDQQITHVALAMTGRHMLEAGGGGSSTVNLEAAIRQNAFVRIRPITSRTDLVAMVDPPWSWRI